MPISLILTMVGLLFVLIVLVFAYVYRSRGSKSVASQPERIETFESLCAVIQNPASDTAALRYAAERIVERFGSIDLHTIATYKHLIEALCTHPKTDSKLILRFEKSLRSINPRFEHEIERSLAVGLASRG